MSYDDENGPVSAFVFNIVREAFRKSIREMNLTEEHWENYAKLLFQSMTDREPEESMIDRIISGLSQGNL